MRAPPSTGAAEIIVAALLMGLVFGDLGRVRGRANDRNLERVVHDGREGKHGSAVGRPDDADNFLAFDELAILSDGLDRIVLVVA